MMPGRRSRQNSIAGHVTYEKKTVPVEMSVQVTAIQCECDFDSLGVTGSENKSDGPGPNIVLLSKPSGILFGVG